MGPADPGRGVRTVRVFVRSDAGQLAGAVARVDAGDLKIDVAERRPLTDLPAVHDQAAAGRLAGKTVLNPRRYEQAAASSSEMPMRRSWTTPSGWPRTPGLDDVEVTLQVAAEGTHVFQFQFGALDEADEAIDEVARFFQRHLS